MAGQYFYAGGLSLHDCQVSTVYIAHGHHWHISPRYKVINSTARLPLPDLTGQSSRKYPKAFDLKLHDNKCDCNHCVLPLVIVHKLSKFAISVGLFGTDNIAAENSVNVGQWNIQWKTLLDILYKHQLTIINWPDGVSAPGTDFKLRQLSADELHALVVPFLKEHMGNYYTAKDPDNTQSGNIMVPPSSFQFQKWSEGEWYASETMVLIS